MLHDRHQLDVREAHALRRSRPAAARSRGRSGAARVGRDRAATSRGAPRRPTSGASSALALRAVAHPLGVAPLVVEVPHHRAGARRRLAAEGVRVGLVDAVAAVLATRCGTCRRCPASPRGTLRVPDAGVAGRLHRVRARVPAVEVADHRHRRARSAPRPRSASPPSTQVRAELLVQARVRALAEQVQVVPGQAGGRADGVGHGSALSPRGSASTAGTSTCSIYFDHADGLRSALPLRGPRHPRAAGLPHRRLAAHARRPRLPRRHRSAARPYHRAQRAARRQPEGRRPRHPAGARFGPGPAAGRRLHRGAADPRHGELTRSKPPRRRRASEPAGRRPPLGDARGREERPVLPEPGAARRRDAWSRSSSTTCRSRSSCTAFLRLYADGGALCGLLLEKLPSADERDPDGWNRVTPPRRHAARSTRRATRSPTTC